MVQAADVLIDDGALTELAAKLAAMLRHANSDGPSIAHLARKV